LGLLGAAALQRTVALARLAIPRPLAVLTWVPGPVVFASLTLLGLPA